MPEDAKTMVGPYCNRSVTGVVYEVQGLDKRTFSICNEFTVQGLIGCNCEHRNSRKEED